MPLYDVECKECGQVFEVQIPLDKFDEFKEGAAEIKCGKSESTDQVCSSDKMRILISPLKTKHKSWWNWRPVA